MPLRILITGFEPFGGASHNPSGDAARALDRVSFTVLAGMERRSGDVRGRLLPVVWDEAAEALVTHIEADKPHVVVSLGMADRRFRVEQIAGDARIRRPDNHERFPRDPRDHPTTTFATGLPREPIERAIRAAGGEVEPSTNAGGFICDNVFFALMKTYHGRGSLLGLLRAGFIHVPNHAVVPERLPQQTLNRAILAAVEATVNDLSTDEFQSTQR